MVHPDSPADFRGKSTEDIQAHFEEQRLNGTLPQATMWKRRVVTVDLDEQFKRLLTVVEREITKLMDVSHSKEPLDAKLYETVVGYTKLISSLKKQIAEDLRDMSPDDIEKVAGGS